MKRLESQHNHWLFSVNPHDYHWDTLFVKGKEMWRGAGTRPDTLRALKQVRQGDRVLCYHAAPERALSDGPNALRLDLLPELWRRLRALDALVKSGFTSE